MIDFSCRPILIGSLPMTSHVEALDTIFNYTPSIPLWPQLPKFAQESMVRQFAAGLPGLTEDGSSFYVNTESPTYIEEMAAFYEDYLQVHDHGSLSENPRFSLNHETAAGFFFLLERVATHKDEFLTLKGQVTGPMTTGIGIRNQEGTSIFYDDNLRDMVTKIIAMKARGRWNSCSRSATKHRRSFSLMNRDWSVSVQVLSQGSPRQWWLRQYQR